MAAGAFDGVRELRSRLPNVSETVIAHFLSKYNVEECYERLKNGIDDTNEMSDFDGGLLYGGAGGPQNGALPGTNATMSPALSRKTSEEQRQRWSHNLDTLSYQPPPYPDPYITTPSPIKSPSHERKISQPSPLSSSFDDILSDQRKQLDQMKKIKESFVYDVNALKSEADLKRQTLTALRIEVSEVPTKLEISNLKDIISTLEYDIQSLENKVQVERTQVEMKGKLDVYTEEGVRWNCQKCAFLNHPLMSRCESCDSIK